MNKHALIFFIITTIQMGCIKYDDTVVKSDINDLKSRVAALEMQCKNMNDNLTSLQAILDAIQKNDGIVSIVDLPDGLGYSVKFISGKVIYLYNGKDGIDGVTPIISVSQDSDGDYYWTVNGEWLLVDDKKVHATGNDGKDALIPQFKIENSFWYISYDNGNSWDKLGKATGENENNVCGLFKSVTVENGYVVFVMNDSSQTTFMIPLAGTITVSSIKYIPESIDDVVKVRYTKSSDRCIVEDIIIKFEVLPQKAIDYVVANWKECLVAKAVYAAPSRVSIGDYVIMKIKNVVRSKDNTIVVTIDANSLDDLFFSVNLVVASLRLSVKMNGNELVSSDYLWLSPLFSNDKVIEYTTESGNKLDNDFFKITNKDYLAIAYANIYASDFGRFTFEWLPDNSSPLRCLFNKDNNLNSNDDLKSLRFVSQIDLEQLSIYKCTNLTYVDLTKANTQNVTNMNGMFQGCSGLTTLDLSAFNTENVTSMIMMFEGCNSLHSLNLSSFNTENVQTMSWMFFSCNSLTSLDLSNFNTSNVKNMHGMFYDCRSITSLDLSNFNTTNVTNMTAMFSDCRGLTDLKISGLNTENTRTMNGMFSGCSSLSSLDLSSFNTERDTTMAGMFEDCSSLKLLDLSNFNTMNVKSMFQMFKGCNSLTSLDISGFNTENVTEMGGMFKDCYSLTSLDLSGFTTRNVRSMYSMFSHCNGITRLDLSGLTNEKVTYMTAMFYGCRNLTSLNLSGFGTENAIEMGSMFEDCSSLLSLDLSGFDTKQVKFMNNLFKNCSSLTNLNLSRFNTSNVKDMSDMFYGCCSLTNLDLSAFNTQNVTEMGGMFEGCSGLTSIDLSGFSTGNVTSMSDMFNGCVNLTKLDISGFDMKEVQFVDQMFYGCTNLKEIIMRDCDVSTINQIRKIKPDKAVIITD